MLAEAISDSWEYSSRDANPLDFRGAIRVDTPPRQQQENRLQAREEQWMKDTRGKTTLENIRWRAA
jgi:hypothetical protein